MLSAFNVRLAPSAKLWELIVTELFASCVFETPPDLILTAPDVTLKSLEENVIYFQSPSEINSLSEIEKKKITEMDLE